MQPSGSKMGRGCHSEEYMDEDAVTWRGRKRAHSQLFFCIPFTLSFITILPIYYCLDVFISVIWDFTIVTTWLVLTGRLKVNELA